MKKRSIGEYWENGSAIIALLIFLFVFILPDLNGQTAGRIQISGTIKDASTNEFLPGVSVISKGTSVGTVTDLAGKFSIDVTRGARLEFSFIGYEPSELVVSKNQVVQIQLKASVASLDEVVVIGYGITTKKEITGSISTVKTKDFNKGVFNDPMGLLQGKVAGLSIVNPDGADPQAKYEIILRGTNTLTSGQGPLIIIDGVAGADLRNISPDEVESIDVLKDGSAAAIYGTRARRRPKISA